jgi:hydrogenase maturation protease
MNHTLILGLGNPLMGDDGVGCRAARLLADDPRLPLGAQSIPAGTDLLRWMDRIEGHEHVILIDAMRAAPDARIEVLHDDFTGLSMQQTTAHSLSAAQAIALMQQSDPALCNVRFTLVAVPVASAEIRIGLSPETEARLPAILDTVLLELICETNAK